MDGVSSFAIQPLFLSAFTSAFIFLDGGEPTEVIDPVTGEKSYILDGVDALVESMEVVVKIANNRISSRLIFDRFVTKLVKIIKK